MSFTRLPNWLNPRLRRPPSSLTLFRVRDGGGEYVGVGALAVLPILNAHGAVRRKGRRPGLRLYTPGGHCAVVGRAVLGLLSLTTGNSTPIFAALPWMVLIFSF